MRRARSDRLKAPFRHAACAERRQPHPCRRVVWLVRRPGARDALGAARFGNVALCALLELAPRAAARSRLERLASG